MATVKEIQAHSSKEHAATQALYAIIIAGIELRQAHGDDGSGEEVELDEEVEATLSQHVQDMSEAVNDHFDL